MRLAAAGWVAVVYGASGCTPMFGTFNQTYLPSSFIRLHAVLLVGAIGIPNNLQYGRALLLWVLLTLTSVTQILVLEVKWYPLG